MPGMNDLRRLLIQRVNAKTPLIRITCRACVRAMNDGEGVISEDLEHHKVANSFTDANPVTMMLMAIRGKWGVTHVAARWLTELKVQKGADVVGGAQQALERSSSNVGREAAAEHQASALEAK